MTIDPTIGKDGKRYPLTAKQLAFIDEFMVSGNASDAYRKAFPGSVNWKSEALRAKASELAAKPKVASEINRRRAVVADNTTVTVNSLIAECDEARTLALETRNAGALVSATQLKAKLTGNLTDKIDQTVRQAEPADLKPELTNLRRAAQQQVTQTGHGKDGSPVGSNLTH